MKGLKRQVSPGVAVFFVIIVLAIVQWVWWRGLVYRVPQGTTGRPSGPMGRGGNAVLLPGHSYIKVETYAGDVEPGDVDGPGYSGRFDRPTGIALDDKGRLYVCDTGNNRIRRVDTDGSVTTLAGGDLGFEDGSASTAKFNAPCGICVAPDGAVYVADTGNRSIRRIKDGMVSTLAPRKDSTVPVNISYKTGARPLLVVTNVLHDTLEWYDTSGGMVGTRPHPNSVAITGDDLEPPAGKQAVQPNAIPIGGSDALADVARRPVLRHLVGWCHIGSGALAIDSEHAALFLLRSGSADVLAGLASSNGPVRGYVDANGDKALFYAPTAVVTDAVKYAYVADTGNNCIRRCTLPDFLFH